MPIQVQCAQCGATQYAADDASGTVLTCACGHGIVVEAPATSSVAAFTPSDTTVSRSTKEAARDTRTTRLAVGGGLVALVGLVAFVLWWFYPEAGPEMPPGGMHDPFPVASAPVPEFPALPQKMERLLPNVEFCEVKLDRKAPAGEGRLWIYLPTGAAAESKRPCVLMAPAGGTMLSGMALDKSDRHEHLPYVQNGFVVVAYSLDGPVPPGGHEDGVALRRAYKRYVNSQAGLINARNALEFALARLPQVDPERIIAPAIAQRGRWRCCLPRTNRG